MHSVQKLYWRCCRFGVEGMTEAHLQASCSSHKGEGLCVYRKGNDARSSKNFEAHESTVLCALRRLLTKSTNAKTCCDYSHESELKKVGDGESTGGNIEFKCYEWEFIVWEDEPTVMMAIRNACLHQVLVGKHHKVRVPFLHSEKKKKRQKNQHRNICAFLV